MQLINKRSKEVQRQKTFARFSPFISIGVSGKFLHLPVSLVELAEIRIGSYFHFVDIGRGSTGFIINNDPTGFMLYSNSKKDASLRCGCKGAIDWFLQKHILKRNEVHNFYVYKLDTEFQGCTLYEIDTKTQRIKSHSKAKKGGN